MAPDESGLPVSTPLLRCDSDSAVIKWWSLFLHSWGLGGPRDSDEQNMVKVTPQVRSPDLEGNTAPTLTVLDPGDHPPCREKAPSSLLERVKCD